MGIQLASSFDMNAALPLDSRTVVADATARDAILAGRRFEGMIVYVEADLTNYQLVGGILDANWVELSGGGGGFKPLVTTNTNSTLTEDDGGALVNTSSGAVTVTLPDISNLDEGAVIVVKKLTSDVNAVTVVGFASEEFDDTGATSDSLTEYLDTQMYILDAGIWYKLLPVTRDRIGATQAISASTVFTALQHGVKLVDATLAASTITLPDATLCPDKIFTIKKIDSTSNTVTIQTTSSQQLDGALTYILYDQYAVCSWISHGGNWYRLS